MIIRWRLSLALALAVLPLPAQAQIIRGPAAAPASGTDSSAAGELDAGRRAQADFENFRRHNLPASRASRPSSCDEQVGRFCYWYDENEPPPPR